MDWNDTLLATAAVVVALGIIIGALWKVYKVAHRIDAALGVDRQGRTLAERMDDVEHELFPNRGSSIKDQVTRLETAHGQTHAELRVVKEMLTALLDRA